MRELIVLMTVLFVGCANESPAEKNAASNISAGTSLAQIQPGVYSQNISNGMVLDLSQLTQLNTVFVGKILTNNLLCSANMVMTSSGDKYELTINGKTYVGGPITTPDTCTRGMNPAICESQTANANAAATQNAVAECAKITDTYGISIGANSLTACPTVATTRCVIVSLK